MYLEEKSSNLSRIFVSKAAPKLPYSLQKINACHCMSREGNVFTIFRSSPARCTFVSIFINISDSPAEYQMKCKESSIFSKTYKKFLSILYFVFIFKPIYNFLFI